MHASEGRATDAPAGTAPLLRPFDPYLHSGPLVARTFQRAYAGVLLFAWASLASQVRLLAGRQGLLPVADLLARARDAGFSPFDLPTLFWLGDSDALLLAGTWLGMALALLALLGRAPRLCFLLSAPLYLSYAVGCSEFTAFQWDNLLVESALLSACLPADRPSRLAHFALRALLFKLYFESGIAKWQSSLHDWQDGSAMLHYYETAPLPAALAWYAHQLPAWFHKLESWGALVLELPLTLLVFGPRRARLLAFFALSGFQLINTATANYGFFTYMAVTLHLFLLTDADLGRVLGKLGIRRRSAVSAESASLPAIAQPIGPTARAALRAALARVPGARLAKRARRLGAPALLCAWLLASGVSARLAFGRVARDSVLYDVAALYQELRVANVYHLFGSITTERIEPQFETLDAAGHWHEHDLRYKPGDPGRRPPYVAPHQPRVDFRLWFYGLSFRRGLPRYVSALLDRMCARPGQVQALFAHPLPQAPRAVRIVFLRYRFTTPAERARNGHYWSREPLGALPARPCP